MALSKIEVPSLDVGQLGSRNRVINGSMAISQRGISSTTNSGYVTVDRFRISNGSVGNLTTTQESTNGPSGVSKYSMKVTATNTASLPAGSDGWIRYVIETKDIENLNLSDPSKHFTVSFYVKCSDTGQSSIGVTSGDFGSAQYVSPFTIANANTWQRVSVTIPCSSALSNVTGDYGLRLYWDIGAGTTYQTSSTNQLVTGGKYASSGNLQITGVNGRYLQITGVQLEAGEATPFEHENYGTTLQKCQRYYYQIGDGTGFGSAQSGSGANAYLWAYPFRHPVPMRATPSLTLVSGGSTYFVGGIGVTIGTPTGDLGTVNTSSMSIPTSNKTNVAVHRLGLSGFSFTRGMGYGGTSGFIHCDAEV